MKNPTQQLSRPMSQHEEKLFAKYKLITVGGRTLKRPVMGSLLFKRGAYYLKKEFTTVFVPVLAQTNC